MSFFRTIFMKNDIFIIKKCLVYEKGKRILGYL